MNTIPEIRLLLLHFSPNESSSVVIAWQIWWLIPRRTRVSYYLQYLRIRLVEIFETIALAHDLVQNRVTASSLTPPCWVIGSPEKHQAPQKTTLEALALAARAKIFQQLYLFQSAEVAQMSTQLHLLFWEVAGMFWHGSALLLVTCSVSGTYGIDMILILIWALQLILPWCREEWKAKPAKGHPGKKPDLSSL